MKTMNCIIVFTVVVLMAAGLATADMSSTNYQIPSSALAAGGGILSSTNYRVSSILGQSSPLMDQDDPPESASYSLYPGFWYSVEAEDADGDGVPDAEDNCPNKPNGPDLGTCSATSDKPGITCAKNADCANGCSSNGYCFMGQEDADGDSVGNVCDNCPSKCNSQQLDADVDGIGDVCDQTPGCGGCGQPQCETQC